jgi:hypothetical protein
MRTSENRASIGSQLTEGGANVQIVPFKRFKGCGAGAPNRDFGLREQLPRFENYQNVKM